jgi:hypothetical protein
MRRALLGLTLLFAQPSIAQSSALPSALEPWREWVLDAHPELPCPLLQGPNQRICAWPGRFGFSVDQQRASFNGSVQTYAETDFPLPGSTSQWPEAVTVNGQAVAVVAGSRGPQVRLAAGNWQITGAIEFERRPEELSLPPSYALLDLQLDAQTVEHPRRTPGGLWLGRVLNESNPQADSLSLEVYRLLSDDAPPQLRTVLRLNVAGRAREQRLSSVLPKFFAYTDLRSELNVRLDGNDLLLQLRPGSFELGVDARATQALEQVAPPVAIAPWPNEEIWSYAANAGLRESTATAATPIDPAQADVPQGWRAYASFVLSAEQPMTLSFGNRGLANDEANRLTLDRQLWLSFDAQRWVAKDRISGSMRSGWRLDAQPPFALTQASSQGEPVLVTRVGERTGVELRSPYVNVEAGAEAPFGGVLPATGWASDFESTRLRLELPPGWRLLHLGGADRTTATWLGGFDLVHIGALLLIAVLSWRLGGLSLALLLTAVGVLGRGENAEPSLMLAAVLLVIVVLSKLPAGRKRHIATLLSWLVLAGASLQALPFIREQVRLAIYPQLERLDLAGNKPEPATPWTEYMFGGTPDAGSAGEFEVQMQDMPAPVAAMTSAPPPAPPPPPPPKLAMESNQMDLSRSKAGSGNQVQEARRSLERYSKGTNLQAGKAEPEWRWNGHSVSFDGRVSASAELRPWLLSPMLNLLWRLCAALFVIFALLLLARQLRRQGSLPRGQNWLWLSASMLCVPTLQAAELPDSDWLQRLEQRLLQPEPCRQSGCANTPRATVRVIDGQLSVLLDSHAQALTAVAMPELVERPWSSVEINGNSSSLQLYDNQVWVVLPAGIHRVELRATIDPSAQQRLRFRALPARVSCAAARFVCSGITDGRLQSDTLELTPEAIEVVGERGVAPTRSSIATFVRIERDFSFELDWEVQTTVFRVAPQTGGLTVRIPLLEGEQLLTEGLEDTDGSVDVSLRSGESSFRFSSRIAPISSLVLNAAPWNTYAEVWRLRPGPAWRLSFSGVPAVEPMSAQNEWVHSFYPLPGEQLSIQLERPAAAAGTTLAIDRVNLRTVAGARQRDNALNLILRATQGGQHQINLPKDAELTAVRIDGRAVNLRLNAGVLNFPVHPGAQTLEVNFREDLEPSFRTRLPSVVLNAAASNVSLELVPAAKRWLLWTRGPSLGPVLGFWLTLALALLAVLAGKRLRLLPPAITTSSALLLALGTVLLGWWTLPTLIALAALLLSQQRYSERLQPWAARTLGAVTALSALLIVPILAMSCLAAVSSGPDLQLGGLYSNAGGLRWFADSSDGNLPQVTLWSTPLWVYQAILLAWGAWLSWTLYQWLGGSVRGYIAQWRSRQQRNAPATAVPEGRM